MNQPFDYPRHEWLGSGLTLSGASSTSLSVVRSAVSLSNHFFPALKGARGLGAVERVNYGRIGRKMAGLV